MCFIPNKPVLKLKVAKRDIICYKVMGDYDTYSCTSLIIGYNYVYNTIYSTVFGIGMAFFGNKLYPIVKDGYHSFKTVRYIKNKEYKFQSVPPIFKCIIPKGATYMENKHVYVSNKIKIMGKI